MYLFTAFCKVLLSIVSGLCNYVSLERSYAYVLNCRYVIAISRFSSVLKSVLVYNVSVRLVSFRNKRSATVVSVLLKKIRLGICWNE